ARPPAPPPERRRRASPSRPCSSPTHLHPLIPGSEEGRDGGGALVGSARRTSAGISVDCAGQRVSSPGQPRELTTWARSSAAEQGTFNPRVLGSNPSGLTKIARYTPSLARVFLRCAVFVHNLPATLPATAVAVGETRHDIVYKAIEG